MPVVGITVILLIHGLEEHMGAFRNRSFHASSATHFQVGGESIRIPRIIALLASQVYPAVMGHVRGRSLLSSYNPYMNRISEERSHVAGVLPSPSGV